MKKSSLLVLGTVLLAVGLVIWLQGGSELVDPSTDSGTALGAQATMPAAPPIAKTVPKDSILVELPPVEPTDAADSREAVPASSQTFDGFVRDSKGQSIEGAEISWTPRSLGRDFSMWSAGSWQELQTASSLARSDQKGAFHLDVQVQGDGVLWVTRAGFHAAFEWTSWKGPVTRNFTLEPSEALEVSLLRNDGGDLSGSTIIYRGASRRDVALADLDDFSRARQLLVRAVYVTKGQGGPYLLPEIGNRIPLWAEQAELVSKAQFASPPGPVELVLQPSFELDVQVTGVEADRSNPVALSVFSLGEDTMGRLIQLDGTGHARERLPLVQTDFYRANLGGGGLAADTADFPQPRPNELVTLAFEGHAGADVPLRFVDPESTPIAEVRGGVNWDAPDGSPRTTSPVLHSSESGEALLGSVPAGLFWIEYHHPDFEDSFAGPFVAADLPRTPKGELETLELVLAPLGRVHGTVLGAGEKLTDYKLFTWPVGTPAWRQSTPDFQLDEDGDFRFQAAATSLNIAAWAEGFAQARPVVALVSPGADAEVELSLPVGILGHGEVLDAATRRPIEGAQVWRELSAGGVPYYQLETPLIADSSGHFEGQGFPLSGLTSVVAEAPGYVAARATAALNDPANRQAGIDFGKVMLAEESTLDLVIRGLPTGPRYALDIAGTDATRQELGLAAGVARAHVTGVSMGDKSVLIWSDKNTMALRQRIPLEGQGPWTVALDLGSGSDLLVNLGGLEAPTTGTAVLMASFESTGFAPQERQLEVSPEAFRQDELTFGGLPPGTVTLRLDDSSGTALAVGVGVVVEGSTNFIQLDPSAPALTVRVVTPDGSPLAGTYVYASPLEAPSIDRFYAVSDEEGLAHIGRVPFGTAHLRATRGDGAFLSGLTRPVPTDGEPLEIVFDANHMLSLRALDGEVPLAGLFVNVLFKEEGISAIKLPLDGSGALLHGPVSDVEFECHPIAPWIWPEVITIAAVETGAAPRTIQLRRRGDAEIELANEEGAPLADVEVEFVDLTSNTEVRSWLEQGRIAASSSSLSTDAHGKLRVTGLPHGKYAWSLPALGLGGTLVVPALGEAHTKVLAK